MDCRPVVPEAVLFDILLLLPVVSLSRFKTVCKSWCAIIESSTFITEQLNRNSKKNDLIVCNDEGKVFMMSDRNHEVCSQMNLEGISPGFEIVSSCNGILCLAYEHSGRCWRLSLWNPATKQVRQLPESSYFSKRINTSFSNNFALGFDIKTNDYKIVSISLADSGSLLNDTLVQMYNMRADSWRTIHEGDDFPIRWLDIFHNAICWNEMCFWMAGSSTENTMLIFYFDLTKEVYGTVSLPCDRSSSIQYSLALVNDKLTYIELNHEISHCYYEIWTMDQFGVKGSWNKLYKLNDTILSRFLRNEVLYLSKNGDFILVSKNSRETGYELYLYCIATGEAKKLGFQNAYRIEGYIESMVSV